MTPFLSRLVARAVASTEPALAARPVVPPLFAAGPPVEPVEPAGDVDWTAPRDRNETPATLLSPTHLPSATTRAASGESPSRGTTPAQPPNLTRGRTEGDRPFTVTVHPDSESPAGTAVPVAHRFDAPPSAAMPRQPADVVVHPQPDSGRHAIRTAPVAPRAPALPSPIAPIGQAAPVVRVTIGRIEVRAVTSPAPTTTRVPAPAQKRTAIVLEDYLRGNAR